MIHHVSWFALFVAGLVSVLVVVVAMGVTAIYAADPEGRSSAAMGWGAMVGICGAAAVAVTLALAVVKALA